MSSPPAKDEEWKKRIDAAEREGHVHLALTSCGMSQEGRMEYLYDFFTRNKSVTWLGLNGNGLGAEEMRVVSELLKVDKLLRMLDLGSNCIDADGMRFLSEGIQANDTLKRLFLQATNIGDEGLQHLTGAVRVNTALLTVSVDFGNDDISVDAKTAFDAVLDDMPAREAAREEYLAQQSHMVKSAAKR